MSSSESTTTSKYITLTHLTKTTAALLEKIYDVQEEAEKAIESASSSVNADSPVFQNQITIGETVLSETNLQDIYDFMDQSFASAVGVYF